MDTKDSVQRRFGRVAESYTTSPVHASGPELSAMLEAVSLTGAEEVLDAGCGTGHTALAFAPRVARVVGVDLTEPMLEQGRRLASERGVGNVSFVRADVESLPFGDGSFDLVTSRYSAHHYPHPEVALREIARVLRPRGAFLLADVVSPEDPAIDTFLNAIELIRDPSHVRDHTKGRWLRMLASAGFQAEVVGVWPLLLEFGSWVARMGTPELSVEQLRVLLGGAPSEVREALGIGTPDRHSFTVPVALFRGTLVGWLQ